MKQGNLGHAKETPRQWENEAWLSQNGDKAYSGVSSDWISLSPFTEWWWGQELELSVFPDPLGERMKCESQSCIFGNVYTGSYLRELSASGFGFTLFQPFLGWIQKVSVGRSTVGMAPAENLNQNFWERAEPGRADSQVSYISQWERTKKCDFFTASLTDWTCSKISIY